MADWRNWSRGLGLRDEQKALLVRAMPELKRRANTLA